MATKTEPRQPLCVCVTHDVRACEPVCFVGGCRMEPVADAARRPEMKRLLYWWMPRWPK